MNYKKAAGLVFVVIVSVILLVRCGGEKSDIQLQVEDNAYRLQKIEKDIEELKNENRSEHINTRGAIEGAQRNIGNEILQLQNEISQLRNRWNYDYC